MPLLCIRWSTHSRLCQGPTLDTSRVCSGTSCRGWQHPGPVRRTGRQRSRAGSGRSRSRSWWEGRFHECTWWGGEALRRNHKNTRKEAHTLSYGTPLTCFRRKRCWPAGRTAAPSSRGGRCSWNLDGPLGGSHPGRRRPSGRAGSLAPPPGPATVCWCSAPWRDLLSLELSVQPPGPAASRWCTGCAGSRGSWCHFDLRSCAARRRGRRRRGRPRLRHALAYLDREGWSKCSTSACLNWVGVTTRSGLQLQPSGLKVFQYIGYTFQCNNFNMYI